MNIRWTPVFLLIVIASATTRSAIAQDPTRSQRPATLPVSETTIKSAYKDHFLIGVAINRSIATGAAGRRGMELVEKDIALVKEQFNQIAPENDLKCQLIHPREGADGYNFEPTPSSSSARRTICLSSGTLSSGTARRPIGSSPVRTHRPAPPTRPKPRT